MTEPGVVAEKLADYLHVLDAQQTTVARSFNDLNEGYARLRETWEGEGARQFQAEWDRTAAAFDTYIERIRPLIDQLRQRIEQLRAIEAGMN